MRYKKGSFIVVPNQDLLKGKSPTLQCVYMWLCFHANQDGKCFPSYKTIAEESGIDRSTAIRTMKQLVSLGVVVRENRLRKDGTSSSNSYELPITEGVQKVVHEVVAQCDHTVAQEDHTVALRHYHGGTVPPLLTKSIELNPVNNAKALDASVKPKKEPRQDITIALKGIEAVVGMIDEPQSGRRRWAKLFLDSKIPEMYKRKYGREPNKQESINALCSLFRAAMTSPDKFIQTNASSLQWVYRNIGKILNSHRAKNPKIDIIS